MPGNAIFAYCAVSHSASYSTEELSSPWGTNELFIPPHEALVRLV